MNTPVSLSIMQADAERIRACGARATPARLAVLRLLEESAQALSHHDVETQLAATGTDRVTLYRVLDWMVDVGLAHRVSDGQRFHFSRGAGQTAQSSHAHFRCQQCHKLFCLPEVKVALPHLPAGFRAEASELCVNGTCAACNG